MIAVYDPNGNTVIHIGKDEKPLSAGDGYVWKACTNNCGRLLKIKLSEHPYCDDCWAKTRTEIYG